jgi:Bacterial regulatory proteins, tetR family
LGERWAASNVGAPPIGERAAHDDIMALGRRRILQATQEILLEQGPAGVTVKEVITRAGISCSEFHGLFGGMRTCAREALGSMGEEWRMGAGMLSVPGADIPVTDVNRIVARLTLGLVLGAL